MRWCSAVPAPVPPRPCPHGPRGREPAVGCGEGVRSHCGLKPWSARHQALHQFRPLPTSLCPVETSPPPSPSLPRRSPLEAPRAQGKLGAVRPRGHTCPHCHFCRTLTAEMVSGAAGMRAQPAGERRAQGPGRTCPLPPPRPPALGAGQPCTAHSAHQLVEALVMQTPSPRQQRHPSQAGGLHSILFILSSKSQRWLMWSLPPVCGACGANSRRSRRPDPTRGERTGPDARQRQGHTHVCLGT